MRISRAVFTNFRGWRTLELVPRAHVLIAGVPRAGRSDIIAGLIRVLDPESLKVQAVLTDIFQVSSAVPDPGADLECVDSAEIARPGLAGTSSQGQTERRLVITRAQRAVVEVTLDDLDPELLQLLETSLEFSDDNGLPSPAEAGPQSGFCVRIAYQLTYDDEADVLEQVVYFPARSNPDIGQYSRVPAKIRKALPVVVLRAGRPLQLRAEGVLRRLVTERDPTAAASAFDLLRASVADATAALSADLAISASIDSILAVAGGGTGLGDFDPTQRNVSFLTEDGSLSALLRAVQPAMQLDAAGTLPLVSHGSTAAAILSAAEALLLSALPGGVVLADDFGDQLDTAAAEHLASILRKNSGQVWLSTRRPEVARAFDPGEIVRLARHAGVRSTHTLETVLDRKALTAFRLLHTQILAALTAPVIVITEGPHDLLTYAAADRLSSSSRPPLSSYGVRIISADNGQGGGTSQIPRVANLARQLGFRVLALIDQDKETAATLATLAKIEASCDVILRLPNMIAVEGAITSGVPAEDLRAASEALVEFDIPDPSEWVPDDKLEIAINKVLHKQSLHEPFLSSIFDRVGLPPLLEKVLDAVALAAPSNYRGTKVLDIESTE
jgi:putative ATP-dependent endonuclease of OLD family